MARSINVSAALDPLFDRGDLCRFLKISRSTSYEWQDKGFLPKGLRIGPAVVRWRRSDLEAFLQRAAADRGES